VRSEIPPTRSGPGWARRGWGCLAIAVGLFCLWALWRGFEDNWERGTFDELRGIPTRTPTLVAPIVGKPPPAVFLTPTPTPRVVFVGTPLR
jgi:hypothetical protein